MDAISVKARRERAALQPFSNARNTLFCQDFKSRFPLGNQAGSLTVPVSNQTLREREKILVNKCVPESFPRSTMSPHRSSRRSSDQCHSSVCRRGSKKLAPTSVLLQWCVLQGALPPPIWSVSTCPSASHNKQMARNRPIHCSVTMGSNHSHRPPPRDHNLLYLNISWKLLHRLLISVKF